MSVGFVYKWTNKTNGKWYIGSHKGTPDDGYVSSSKVFAAAIKKHGKENFEREILFEGDYYQDKIKDIEANYLHKEDAANNPMSYNRNNIVGPYRHSHESNLKRSNTLKGQRTGKTYEEIFGIETAAKQRKLRSLERKGKSWIEVHGKEKAEAKRSRMKNNTWNVGRKQSEESNLKRSMSAKGRSQPKVSCPHCNKVGGERLMKHWHFNNCRSKNPCLKS